MKQASVEAQLFYDPFAAEENQEFLDGAAAFDTILARYKNDEVVHDYTADDFVKDAEALMLDADFQERWSEMSYIAAQMHQLCGDDHGMMQRFEQSDVFSSFMQNNHDGHDHSHNSHDHKHEKENDDGKDAKSKKKNDKKKLGFWALLMTQSKPVKKK